jgi:hypothetical protein
MRWFTLVRFGFLWQRPCALQVTFTDLRTLVHVPCVHVGTLGLQLRPACTLAGPARCLCASLIVRLCCTLPIARSSAAPCLALF